jgi:alanine-synthesizing transaminase
MEAASKEIALHFTQRTAWDREEAPLARAVRERRAAGLAVLDLTVSNPTQCGFLVDPADWLAPLANQLSLRYDPQPFGLASAREAVSTYYQSHAATVPPACLCMMTSTSEAYSFLFRLLCEPGDDVLIATPSYPLFQFLATLNDVKLRAYPLVYEHGWQVQPGSFERLIGPRTRAVMLVHPNNPTGHFISAAERAALEQICVRHGLALIVDEVFLDYPWPGIAAPKSFAAGPHPVLTFVLSGMSKIAGMPQMKLSWLAVLGPLAEVQEAQARLEMIADTYLSVSAPLQHALPAWLAGRGVAQRQVRARVAENLNALDRLLPGTKASRLIGEGGWYAVLRLPTLGPDEAFAERLLQQAGVLVHPGSAFGFGVQGWVVVSLLPRKAAFAAGVARLLETLA